MDGSWTSGIKKPLPEDGATWKWVTEMESQCRYCADKRVAESSINKSLIKMPSAIACVLFLCRCHLLIWALWKLFFMENWAIAFHLWSELTKTLLFFSSVRRVERSTDQVIKPVNVEALSKWVGKIPADVVRDMAVIAPMLSRLGYDPHANPPNYGRPDPKVLDNTRRVS